MRRLGQTLRRAAGHVCGVLVTLSLSMCEANSPARSDLDAGAKLELPDAGANDPGPNSEGLGPLPFAGGDAAAPPDTRCGTPPGAIECPEFLMTFDDVYRALLADLETQRPEDRPFTRYLGLVNRRNAGVCGAALDVDRWAMNKMLNSVSTEFSIALPEAINAERTLYRVDIRRYGWDREMVDAFGTTWTDGWEFIAANNVYASEFEGGAADTVKLETQTALPYTSVDGLLDAVEGAAGVYNALIGAPAFDQLLSDFELDLGIDAVDALLQGTVKGAGFRGSRVSREPRLAQRYPFEADRVYWKVFDFSNNVNQSIFDDPFGFSASGSFAIYSLPNSLHAYLIADENQLLIPRSEILFSDDAPIAAPVSCLGCHQRGILPLRDQVRTYVEANPTNYNPDEAIEIQSVFIPPAEMEALIETDQRVYSQALAQLGFPTDCPEPVSQVQARLYKPLTLRDALADLGVSRATFEEARAKLEPSVAGLLNVGLLERASFGGLFGVSLCAVSPTSGADAGAGAAVAAPAACESLLGSF